MKKYRFLLPLAVAVAIFAVVGCAHNQETVTTASSNPSAKTYNSNDLQKTGKRTSGEALQAADPAVTTSSGH